jgi:protein tyrosine phosphatase (PTP) superfamily phosphohydrolase (DUF442 family)
MRREERVAIWVHGKSAAPSLRLRSARALSRKRDLDGEPTLRQKKVYRRGMDITWVTERIAVGGGIWTSDNMAVVAKMGITHVIDMQIEFDDTPLAAGYAVEVLWNPTDDDFELKPARLFRRGVDFALRALESPETKVFIHCAAGVHRAPMMTLALLGAMGWELEDAMQLIEGKRPVADFAEVYVESVERFLAERVGD